MNNEQRILNKEVVTLFISSFIIPYSLFDINKRCL
jgi:hypothetical protein